MKLQNKKYKLSNRYSLLIDYLIVCTLTNQYLQRSNKWRISSINVCLVVVRIRNLNLLVINSQTISKLTLKSASDITSIGTCIYNVHQRSWIKYNLILQWYILPSYGQKLTLKYRPNAISRLVFLSMFIHIMLFPMVYA